MHSFLAITIFGSRRRLGPRVSSAVQSASVLMRLARTQESQTARPAGSVRMWDRSMPEYTTAHSATATIIQTNQA